MSIQGARVAPGRAGAVLGRSRFQGARLAHQKIASPAQAPRTVRIEAKKKVKVSKDALDGFDGWDVAETKVRGHVEAAEASASAAADAAEAAATVKAAAVPAKENVEIPVPKEPKKELSVAVVAETYQNLPVAAKNALWIPAGILAYTFYQAVNKTYKKYTSGRSRRVRTVNKNFTAVTSIAEYLPGRRGELTARALKGIESKTGFTPELLFRKYLRYLLNERVFDEEALGDLVHLKNVAGLTDEAVAEVLNETGKRTFDKTGILMLVPSGMTAEGLKRKAGGRVMFAKILFLSECNDFITQGTEAAASVDLAAIYGATEEDVAAVRVTSIAGFSSEPAEA
eukprot:CAMPEP_0182869418 /NCGR_PEP_ID=MMETSP0034_2-20130328/9927_1 /TAXON_ID=156128 /ORGANISM="Nephroselmis pyriformis, Strain CCMP717" /LENGTH=340 /DNA_ID=CAMNT_0025001877 /DNA_START=7 /DNA_END=1025 /DNA_ORIENTATION=-